MSDVKVFKKEYYGIPMQIIVSKPLVIAKALSKEAIAKCSGSDNFSEKVGIKIATKRLYRDLLNTDIEEERKCLAKLISHRNKVKADLENIISNIK